jgi:hypothetical protein
MCTDFDSYIRLLGLTVVASIAHILAYNYAKSVSLNVYMPLIWDFSS